MVSLRSVALAVGDALRRAGIDAVLTGGACASFYSRGAYHSVDLDFVLAGEVTRSQLDAVMAGLGFRRHRDRYVHPVHPYFVEFPRGPLAIGDDVSIRPVLRSSGRRTMRLLSPTDSTRDRLAAFYHWNDRQSLQVAIQIALRNRVVMERIRRWSAREGAIDKFEEFRAMLKAARKRLR